MAFLERHVVNVPSNFSNVRIKWQSYNTFLYYPKMENTVIKCLGNGILWRK